MSIVAHPLEAGRGVHQRAVLEPDEPVVPEAIQLAEEIADRL